MVVVSALLVGGVFAVAHARAAGALRPAVIANASRMAWARLGAPGAQVAIVVCGRVAWAGSDGITDCATRRKLTNATPIIALPATARCDS